MANPVPKMRFLSRAFTLAANDSRELDAYNYLYIADATAAITVIILSTGNQSPLAARRGFRAPGGNDIGRVFLRNDSGAPNTFTVETGDGDPLDVRDSSSGGAVINVNVASPNPLPVSVPAGVAVTGTVEIANDVGNALPIAGADAVGAAPAALPVVAGGSDGAAVRRLLVDTSGRPIVAGAAAAGAAVAGNPVLVGASDGANAQALKSDTSGRPIVVGAAAAGAAIAGNPVLVGASDGVNAQPLKSDTSGRPIVVGAAATGAAVAGNPVLAGGSDGVNAQPLAVDTSGRQVVVGAAAAAAAIAGNPVLVGGSDSANVRALSLTTSGAVHCIADGLSGAGGATLSRTRAAGSTNTTNVKNAQGRLYAFVASNTSAAVKYVKLYNKASAPNLAADTPVMVILLPAGQTVQQAIAVGYQFTLGISFAIVAGEADTDATAVTAGDVHLTLGYT